jgi:hypothetical protein
MALSRYPTRLLFSARPECPFFARPKKYLPNSKIFEFDARKADAWKPPACYIVIDDPAVAHV